MLVTNISIMGNLGTGGKRARTQARLVTCALELFEAEGFEPTTVAQIAAAAGVSEMTFFRHFASKEAVVLEDPYDPAIAFAIGAQPSAAAPLVRTVQGMRAAFGEMPELESDVVRRRVRIAARTDSLRAGVARNNAVTERVIAEQLAADGANQLPARVAAAAVMAALTTALFEWATHDDLPLAQAVTVALDTLEASDA